jgi:hypothetical protein
MSNVTINGITIDRAADFTAMKNGELNQLLGEDGAPKYSAGAMKNKTKSALADELRDLVNSIPEAKQPKAKATGAGRGNARQPSVSKTKAVAQSKKCNLLKALVAGKTTVEHIHEVLAVDTVLADYWRTVDTDLEKAGEGVRPRVSQVFRMESAPKIERSVEQTVEEAVDAAVSADAEPFVADELEATA